jgi:alpha-L-rhamnosidase
MKLKMKNVSLAASVLLACCCVTVNAQEAAPPNPGLIRAADIAKQGQSYVLTPKSAEVYPSAITQQSGEIDSAENILKEDGKAAVLRYPKGGKKPFIILDLGRASASGYPVFKVTSRKGTPVVRLAYSTHPRACGEQGGFGRGTCRYLGKTVDLPVLPANPGRYELYTIPRDGTFIAPLIQGQQRYVRVQLDTPGTEVAIDSLHILNKEVHDLSPTAGHFLCNDEIINKIWYASAWTLQIASFPHHNAWMALDGWLAPRKLEHANDVALSKEGAAWDDYRFSFDFEIRTNPDHISHAGWAIRCRDEDNGYVAAINLDGTFTLQKRRNGTYTQLKKTFLEQKILDGEHHHIEVEVKANTITTLLDGKQIDVTKDDSYASGRVGFWHPKEKWFLVDNVKVTNPKGKTVLQDDFSGNLDQWDYARTLGFIADGAKRDRLVWSGDLDWAARNVYYAFRDASYMRDSLKMLAFNQTPEGFMHAAPYPEIIVPPVSGDFGHFASDEFSAWLVPVAWDYLLYTGDKATLREIYPAIEKDLSYLLNHVGENGLFQQRRETSKRAGNLKLSDTGNRTYMNILVQDALLKGARIATALGERAAADAFQSKADALRKAIMEQLWDENGGYFVESLKKRNFEHTGNALALSVGFVSPEQAKRMVPHFKRHQHGKFQSLAIRGLMEYGFGDAAIEAFFAHGWPTLVNTPEVPLTTTECMTLKRGGWGDESHPDTAIAHLFTGYILGVEPTTLAYEHFTVKPVMCSKVNRAKGIVPTPKGDIVTSWKREEKKFTHHLVSPEGTRVTIALPVEGLAKYEVLVNGQRPEDGIQGVGSVDSGGQYLYLRDVVPGSYSSIVTAQAGTYAEDETQSGSKNQGGKKREWRVKAASSHEQGNWGVKKLVDGITTSEKKSKGYSSSASERADSDTWLEIDIRDQKAIKTITLYPRQDAALSNGRSVGFPVDMKILVKKAGEGYSVAKTLTDIPNPKGKPYEIDLYTVVGFPEANSIRIEVTKRGIPAADEPDAYRLQLAELTVKFVE